MVAASESSIAPRAGRRSSSSFRARTNVMPESIDYKAVFDVASVGIILVGLDGRLLGCNRYYCDLVQRTEQELRGLHFQEVTHPDDYAIAVDYFARMLQGELDRVNMDARAM